MPIDQSPTRRPHILLSAFDMHCVVHQNPGMWRYPGDQTHNYKDIEYWVEMARVLEQGGFDALFIADVLEAVMNRWPVERPV